MQASTTKAPKLYENETVSFGVISHEIENGGISIGSCTTGGFLVAPQSTTEQEQVNLSSVQSLTVVSGSVVVSFTGANAQMERHTISQGMFFQVQGGETYTIQNNSTNTPAQLTWSIVDCSPTFGS